MPEFSGREQILQALREGKIDLQGQFLNSSNGTFLGVLTGAADALPVVYKPVRGERPLWDFPAGTLARREAAAFVVSEALGWELVPPTVFRRKGPFGPGSVQLFVEHDQEYHYFNFRPEDRERLRPVALFDVLVNNADRKGGHILCGQDGHLWLIDHGICFHVEDKLRTVVWDFVGQAIPQPLLADVQRLADGLTQPDGWLAGLNTLLRQSEIAALGQRARRLLESGVFPAPGAARAFPWPPV